MSYNMAGHKIKSEVGGCARIAKCVEILSPALWPTFLSLAFDLGYLGDLI